MLIVFKQADMDGRVEEMASKMAEQYTEKKAVCAVHAEECGCGASDAAHAQLQIKEATNTHVWRAFWILLRVRVCVHSQCCLQSRSGGSPRKHARFHLDGPSQVYHLSAAMVFSCCSFEESRTTRTLTSSSRGCSTSYLLRSS